MSRDLIRSVLFRLVPLSLLPALGCVARPPALRDRFADPPREYATAPLWVWNDMLTEEQVISTLRDLAGQGVRQAFVHPRPGLMTPYLSESWFRLWRAALNEAERLDMNLWIYDENSYPSGFAGGWVPEVMPEARGRGLHSREENTPPRPDDATVAVYRIDGQRYEDVTTALRTAGEAPTTGPAATYVHYFIRRATDSPWYGNRCYVDLLYPGVTEKFLEITLEPYRRHFGEQFGRRIPGSFTDEPQLRPAGGLPWTDDLPRQFEQRRGYRLTEHLPCLDRPVGPWRQVRHDYYKTLLELFGERWGKPYHDWCERYGIEFTGHYWEHEWPGCISVPDNMAMYAWHQRPAIDILMNEYDEASPHAQFGNARAVKELASVARQLGRTRTLCEVYGAAGWDLRFEDMKRIGDWIYVLGVNTMDQHLSYVTIRGARKRDHPQSFSYHEPWWSDYHVSARYFARLSAALSAGREVNPVLLIEPTTTAWMYNGGGRGDLRLAEIGTSFQSLVLNLLKAQVEFDIGCEEILAKRGSVGPPTDPPQVSGGPPRSPAVLKVGPCEYATVVIAPLTENLEGRTMDLLEEFADRGGTVWACDVPTHVDGRPSDRPARAAQKSWNRQAAERTLSPDALVARLREDCGEPFRIERSPADEGILFHHRRRLDEGEILFLVNTSNQARTAGTVRSPAGGAERWDPYTGQTEPYPFEHRAGSPTGIRFDFDLPPCGSLLLFLPAEPRPPVPRPGESVSVLAPGGPPAIRRIGPNVLTLDYVDVTAGGQTKKDAYVYAAAQFVFQKNGMPRNPWDSAVQFSNELIAKTFPPDSGFEAVYRFTIAERVPESIAIVIERPDLYAITCNGTPVTADRNDWWLDRAFGRIDIRSAARVGANEVVIKAAPMTIWHELEAAYVIGTFALRPAEKGFVIVPEQGLNLGPWNEQGCPFYAQGVSYTQTFEVPRKAGRYVVALPKWLGSVARVTVNGRSAGHIVSAPYECDVTRHIRRGVNAVEVVVIGTLKNTLGPHHGNPPLGRAWPGSFHKAPESGPPPGTQYSVVGYGLFEPFVLKQVLR